MSTIATASIVDAPVAGNGHVLVRAVTTSASTAVQLVDGPAVGSARPWYRIFADTDLYLTFGDANVAAPDETAVTGNTQAIMIPAGQYMDFRFSRHVTHFRVKGSAAGYIRAAKISQ